MRTILLSMVLTAGMLTANAQTAVSGRSCQDLYPFAQNNAAFWKCKMGEDYSARRYHAVASDAQMLRRYGALDLTLQQVVAQALYLAGDLKESQAAAQAAIETLKAVGREPSEALRKLATPGALPPPVR
jgi:hypothetical protein